MTPITVLVVDDQPDLRLLMRTMITASNDGLECADEAASGEEAVAYLEASDVTVVVLDQMMPGMTGLEAAEKILARRPDQRIILFSAYLDDHLRRDARALGIKACVDKRDFNEVVPTLRLVAAA
jgi:DNA-binding NarL/FixJ family response regulator